jgi:hypothetical protein
LLAKCYLFAAVTSTLLLILVVPLLNGPWWMPAELASIASLFVISIAAGGLTAETYVIARGRTTADLFGTSARKYFMSLVCSLLFLVIVAPSIRSAIDSTAVVDAATVAVLVVLSIALAGLTAQGVFAVVSLRAPRKNAVRENLSRIEQKASSSNSPSSPSHTEGNFDFVVVVVAVADQIDSGFKAFEATLDTRMKELKLLLGAIHDVGLSPNKETNANIASASAPAPVKLEQVKLHRHEQETPVKDQIVDALLGKAKAGGK